MTSAEALEVIQTLQLHFDRQYMSAELNPIWPHLLKCSKVALERAVGIMMKHGKYLPEPDYILKQAQYWTWNLMYYVPPAKYQGIDEGRDVLTLLQGFLNGKMTKEAYAAALFDLSDRYKKPDYSILAQKMQQE